MQQGAACRMACFGYDAPHRDDVPVHVEEKT